MWKDTTQALMQAQEDIYRFATQLFTRNLCQLLSSLWTSSYWNGRVQGEGYGRREKKKRGVLKGREISRRNRWKLHLLTLRDVMSWCNNWPGVGVVGGASVTWLLPTAKLQFSSFSWTAFNWRDIFLSWAHMAVTWLVWLNISGMSRVLFNNSLTCCLSAVAFQRKAIWLLAYVQTLYGEEINQLKCKSFTIQVL